MNVKRTLTISGCEISREFRSKICAAVRGPVGLEGKRTPTTGVWGVRGRGGGRGGEEEDDGVGGEDECEGRKEGWRKEGRKEGVGREGKRKEREEGRKVMDGGREENNDDV